VRRWFRQATGGLPRTFWLLWTGTLINRLGSFVVILMAIYLTGERHFTQSQAGLVIGLYGVGGAIGTMSGGVLADRWGRRPTLLIAQFGAATLMLGLGLVHKYDQIIVAAFLLGVFAEAARPAFSAMMIDVVPDRDRLRAYSLNYWAINLGFACAAIGAGFAAQYNYLLVFAVDAGTTLVTAMITVFFLTETRPATAGQPRSTTKNPGLRTVFRDRVFLVFIGLNLFAVMVMFQHQSTLPIAMTADGLSPATYGWVLAVNGVLIVLGQLFVPRLIAGLHRSRVLALATFVVGIGFGLVAFAHSAGLYALTVVIWTLGEMLQSPSNAALIAELSPTALRGRYQGVNSLSWSAGAALAPIAGSFVQEHLGNATLWLGCAAVGALVAVGQLASGPARERRAAALRNTGATLAAGDDVAARGMDTAPPATDSARAARAVADVEAHPPPAVAEPAADIPPSTLTPARD
jgi:MFS family permease